MSEKSWPSRFGKLGEKVFGEDDPFNDSESHGNRYIISDEMAATKHPVDGKYYTSKTKFRSTTKAHGFEEVGTAYDHGYDPQVREQKERSERYNRNLEKNIRKHFND